MELNTLVSMICVKKRAVLRMSIGSAKVKMCAFCKCWYEPNNESISLKSPAIRLWEYDEEAKRKCMKSFVQKIGM